MSNRLPNNGNFNQSDSLYDLFIDIIDRHRNKSNEKRIELLNNILGLKKNSNKKINLSNEEIISALNLLINWVDHNKSEVESILNMFDLEGNSFEPLSATTFNDYYKWSMMPVIRAIEKSELMEDKNIDVTFGVNIRSDEYRKLISENKDLRDAIIINLKKLKDRKFDRDLFKKIIDEKKLKIDNETIDLICGSEGGKPRSLIDDVIDKKYIPSGENRDKIVISFYKGNDQKLKLQKNKALTNSGNNNAKKNKAEKLLTDRYYIEASGPWHKVTWLETTLMQCVYKTLLEYKLKKQMMSYANWLFGAMFRCSASVNSVLKLESNSSKIIKGALFTGRRTGGYAFMLMQNLFVNDNYANCIGTSSVNSWNDISKIRRSKINVNNGNNVNKIRYVLPPVGTHAHELSMVISALIPQVDKNYPLTQIIGHYLYYYTSPEGSPSPMLPDTLSTPAFLEIASLINVKDKITLMERPFLSVINSARQDSGTMEDFAKILKTYKPSINKDHDFTNNIMASEIENTEDLRTAFNHPQYKSFGAGGFFGDSEKAWYTNTENISMAVKAVRVYLDQKIAFEDTKFETYPAKTGNSNSNSKLEVNTLLNSVKYKAQVNKAKFKRNATYANNTPVSKNSEITIKEQAQNDFNNTINKIIKQILLFGVSGNPPSGNGGHRSIAKYFARNMQAVGRKNERIFKEMWILPVYAHAFESKSDQIDYDSKLELCKRNFESLNDEGYPCQIYVKDYERRFPLEQKKNKLYSADMLKTLRQKFANCEFSWFMGGDTFIDLFSFKKGTKNPLWGSPEYIMKTTPVYYTARREKGNENLSVNELKNKFMTQFESTNLYRNLPNNNNNNSKKEYFMGAKKITKKMLKLHLQNIELKDISSTGIRVDLFKFFNYNDKEAEERLNNTLFKSVFEYIKGTPNIRKYYSIISPEVLKKMNNSYFNKKTVNNSMSRNLVSRLTILSNSTNNQTFKTRLQSLVNRISGGLG